MHPDMQQGAAEAAREARPEATEDQEAWVLARIETALRMAEALRTQPIVAAERDMLNRALDGIVHGCAAEIIETLGINPCFVNIRPGAEWRPPVVNVPTRR